MTDWPGLRDVHGSAADVPALLAQAASVTDWDAPVWGELWSRLCHQGTVAQASHAALPPLARIAASRADLAVDPALFLAAAIIGSTDGPPEVTTVRSVHAEQISRLRPVAEHKLDLVRDRADVLYALHVVAALEGLSAWADGLEGLVDGEVELDCPSCGDHLYLELVEGRLVAAGDPDETHDTATIHPADPAHVGAAEAWLLALCDTRGHTWVVPELLQLFGTAQCPLCGARFALGDALA